MSLLPRAHDDEALVTAIQVSRSVGQEFDTLRNIRCLYASKLIVQDLDGTGSTIQITPDGIDDGSGSGTSAFLPTAGGTMTGQINFGAQEALNAADPTAAQSLVTKNYVDTVAVGGGLTDVSISTATTLAINTRYHAGFSSQESLTLPTAPANGSVIEIRDVLGNFATNIPTLLAVGGDTILDNTALLININYGVVRLMYDSANTKWIPDVNISTDEHSAISSAAASILLIHGVTYFLDTSGNAITATLPTITSSSVTTGSTITIVDSTGSFNTNNCTVNRFGVPDVIQQAGQASQTSMVLSTQYQVVKFRANTTNSTWIVEYQNVSAAGSFLPLAGGSMTGNIVMSSNQITDIARANEELDNLGTLVGVTSLTSTAKKYQYVVNGNNQAIQLPDATTLVNGWSVSIITSSTSSQLEIRNGAAISLGVILANRLTEAVLLDNGSAAGVWHVAVDIILGDPPATVVDINSATNLNANTQYHVDTSGGAFAVALPSAPSDGSFIRIVDAAGAFHTNNLTVNRSGADQIETSLTSYVMNQRNIVVEFVYTSAGGFWYVFGRRILGATSGNDGRSGVAPSPVAGDQNAVLVGDATWSRLPITKHVSINSPVTLEASTSYDIDTSGGAFTVFLPVAGTLAVGQRIEIIGGGTFSTNALTINAAGPDLLNDSDGTVLGASTTFVLDFMTAVLFVDSANSWRIVRSHDRRKLPLTGGTMTGAIAMSANQITGLADPSLVQDAATKNYVDNVLGGLTLIAPVELKTVAALPTYTQAGAGVGATLTATANGAFPSVDGVILSTIGDRILVDSAGSATDDDNGIYTLTQVGDGSNPWILTRATDYDETSEVVHGSHIFVKRGTLCAGCGFVLTGTGTITIDTTNLIFTQFSSPLGYVLKSGDTMSGALAMGTNKITDMGDPTAAQDAATKNYADTTFVNLSGDTMTGALNLGSNLINSVTDPVSAQDAATKNYVDSFVSGLTLKTPVQAVTVAALPAYTQAGAGIGATLTATANGAFPTVDGVTIALNERVLVESSGTVTDDDNGIYTLTQVGDGSNPWILTRATDFDEVAEIVYGSHIVVVQGTTCSGCAFVLTGTGVITVDTTPLVFTQFNSNGLFVSKSGDTMSGQLDMGANKILNVADPTLVQDAATKNYVDTADALKVAKAGDTMTGALAMSTNKVTDMGDPTLAQDAATKNYVDNADALKVAKTGDTMSGVLNMGSNLVSAVTDPVGAQDAATKNYVDTQNASYVLKAGDTMSGALAMGANKVTGVADPTAAQDAATMNYVDTADTLKVAKAGDTMSGVLNMGSNLISAVTDPVGAQDAATKNYVDTDSALKVAKAGDTMTGALAMSTNKVTGVGDPTAAQDAATKNYVDTADALNVAKAGDTMTGALAMSTNKVTGVGDPTAAQDAATKNYVDTADALLLPLAGGTMTGAINMGANLINAVTNPATPQDAATKNYVDSFVSGLTIKGPAEVVTVSALPTYTQAGVGIGATLTATANGAFPAMDGVTLALNERILVTTDGSATDSDNGIYALTQVGDGSNPWILTRATDFDEVEEIVYGSHIVIVQGTTCAGCSFVLIGSGAIIVDTTPLVFSQFSSPGTYVVKTGDTMSGVLNMGNNLISSLSDPVGAQDAATKNYVDTTFVDVAGDSMTGTLAMGSNQITGVADPTLAQDAATKNYVDTQNASFVLKAGDTMTGALAMSANKVTGVADPTAAQDAATMNYVDTADALKVAKAGDTMTGALAMSTNKITGVGDPTLAQDAATKNYVDTQNSAYVLKAGDTMSGVLNMGSNLISAVTDPAGAQDAATKNYVDTADALKVDKAGDTMTGALAMSTNKVTGVGDPTAAQDAATKNYVDTQNAAYVLKAGDTMSGVLAMGANKITGVADPTLAQDAATMTYVDTADALKVAKAGDTMTGALAMSTNKVTGVGDPTLAQDAATKNYVDLADAYSLQNFSTITADPAPAVTRTKYLCDTSGGAFSITIPAGTTVGDWIEIIDAGRSFATNNLTLLRSGSDQFFVQQVSVGVNSAILNDDDTHIFLNYIATNQWFINIISPTITEDGITVVTADPAPAVFNFRYLADTSGGAFNFTLPDTSTVPLGGSVQVFDEGSNFGSNNLTVVRSGTDLIYEEGQSGATSLVLSNNNANRKFIKAGSLRWIVVGGSGGGGTTLTVSNITADPAPAAVSTSYHANTSGGAFTITLPTTPADGSHIQVIDSNNTFSTNNLTIAAGGADTIQTGPSVILTALGQVADLYYEAASTDWKFAAHNVPAPITLQNSEVELSANVSVLSATYQNVLDITLPSVGTYLVIADISGLLSSGTSAARYAFARLFDVTAGSEIANSETTVIASKSPGGFQELRGGNSISEVITVTTATTIRIQGRVNDTNTVTSALFLGGTVGRTRLRYIQLPRTVTTNVVQSTEFVHASASVAAVTTGNAVVYDTVLDSVGTSVSLNTGTGEFTLLANKRYRCFANINRIKFTGISGELRVRWRDTTGAAYFGNETLCAPETGGANQACSLDVEGFITPTVDSVVRVESVNTSNLISVGESNALSHCTVEVVNDNTKVTTMTGATAGTAGLQGLVPTPAAGDQDKVLKGDGTWGAAGGLNVANITADPAPAVVSTSYHADTSGGAFTITLPTTPVDGAIIQILDANNSFATNNLTITRGGSDTIVGGVSLVLTTLGQVADLYYEAASTDWKVAQHQPQAPITLGRLDLEKTITQSGVSGGTDVTWQITDGDLTFTSSTLVTLLANRRYKLMCSIHAGYSAADVFADYEWVNTSNSAVGTVNVTGFLKGNSSVSSSFETQQTIAYAVFTPTVNTDVKLRVTGVGGGTIDVKSSRTWASVEELPTAVITNVAQVAEYSNAILSSLQTTNLSVNDPVRYNTIQNETGDSAQYNVGTFTWTLLANKTYRMVAGFTRVNFSSGTGEFTWQWRDQTGAVDLGIAGSQTSHAAVASVGWGGDAHAIFTPTVDSSVQVVIKKSGSVSNLGDGNSGANGGAYAYVELLADGTKVSTMTGATAGTAGLQGLVPTPAAGDENKHLVGNGSWGIPILQLFRGAIHDQLPVHSSFPVPFNAAGGDPLIVGNAIDRPSSVVNYTVASEINRACLTGCALTGFVENAVSTFTTGPAEASCMTVQSNGLLTLNASQTHTGATGWLTQVFGITFANIPYVQATPQLITVGASNYFIITRNVTTTQFEYRLINMNTGSDHTGLDLFSWVAVDATALSSNIQTGTVTNAGAGNQTHTFAVAFTGAKPTVVVSPGDFGGNTQYFVEVRDVSTTGFTYRLRNYNATDHSGADPFTFLASNIPVHYA